MDRYLEVNPLVLWDKNGTRVLLKEILKGHEIGPDRCWSIKVDGEALRESEEKVGFFTGNC